MTIETINIHPITSKYGQVDFYLWQDSDGWWSCRTGEWNGITSESDDLGPFTSRQEALEAQEEDFQARNETQVEIEYPQSPEARLRQALPSVLYLAERHGISASLAREIYEERGD